MISWPSTMPKPLQSGFSMQPEDRRIASSTVGTSFQKGFGGDVCIADISLTLSRAQAAWLEKFERDTLVQGSRWFSFPVWYAGEVHWEACRFKTRPKVSSINGFHGTYQFSLYVRRRIELMPECMVKIFACWPPCFFILMADILRRLSLMDNLFAETVARLKTAIENAIGNIIETIVVFSQFAINESLNINNKINVVFSNLSAAISSFPSFPSLEAELDIIFIPLFTTLGTVTHSAVMDALSEMED